MPPFRYTDNPVQLGRNRLGCAAHHQSYCPVCCVDYTSMEELDDDASSDRVLNNLEIQNPGQVLPSSSVPSKKIVEQDSPLPDLACYPKRFSPPAASDTPHSLFHETPVRFCGTGNRFTRISDPGEMLIFVDGSCLDNGKNSPGAGCAFVFCPGPIFHGVSAFRLESKGPTGIEHKQTSNRAELRAAIGALQLRFWYGEGYTRVVIATDSEYVVKGVTEWAKVWAKNGWKTNQGKGVKNKDLWKKLLEEIERYQEIARTANWLPPGVPLRPERNILFWHIPRALNTQADALAKEAAIKTDVAEYEESIVF